MGKHLVRILYIWFCRFALESGLIVREHRTNIEGVKLKAFRQRSY